MSADRAAPLKWHGGKTYLARRIVRLFAPHLHYVEPYFGGGAVLLARNPEGVSEVVSDLHGGLTNFWRVLRCPRLFPVLQRMVEATPFSQYEWQDAEPALHAPDAVTRAWAFFVRCRQSLAGRMTNFTGVTRTRTRRGMNNEVSAWLTAVEGLPLVHARLKRVLILDRPAVELIRYQDGPDTLFYLDPPYLHSTRNSTGEYGPHEMTAVQHEELLKVLAGLRGKFLLSGYPSPLYEGFATANGWDCTTFQMPNNAATGKTKRTMTECVWANYRLARG